MEKYENKPHTASTHLLCVRWTVLDRKRRRVKAVHRIPENKRRVIRLDDAKDLQATEATERLCSLTFTHTIYTRNAHAI